MSGVAPTGKVLTWDAMTFRRFDDEGRVVERWIVGDNLGLLHQLGLV
jgi:predicted ester cyclase